MHSDLQIVLPEKLQDVPGAPPEKSSVTRVTPAELSSGMIRDVFAVWNERRANRLMPARENIVPHGIARHLKHVSLMRAIPESEDYEFRIIGDAHVRAYGTRHQGKHLSDLMAEAPGFALALKKSLDKVVSSRAPLAFCGVIGRDLGEARFITLESVFLPIGDSDERVDHIIVVSIYVPRNGFWRESPTIS